MFEKLFASTPHNQGITRPPQKARRLNRNVNHHEHVGITRGLFG